MATYEELYGLRTVDRLRQQVAVAIVVQAQTLLAGTPTQAQADWAKAAIANPAGMANTVVNLVLAANKTASVAVINSATDATVQTNVDAVIDGLILAGA